ncbi:ThuA domain-containing protein [Arenibacter palladensis]|uniref:ThuA domain-containing protein n=1 Tax=Arenibacter palladensis TaxID=237373 RepID=UPI002FD553A3
MKKTGILIILLSIVISAKAQDGNYISKKKNATKVTILGGGAASHDFLKLFGIADGKVLNNKGRNTVRYTEDSDELINLLPNTDILMLTNNRPIGADAKIKLFEEVNAGKVNLMINHPSTWYNWKDWPEYNKQLVGGGARSHEKLQEFEVVVSNPDHPIMKGVPSRFRIIDELYRWEKDPEGVDIEVLAIGRGLESGDEYPVIWIAKHSSSQIIGNTLGHDERAHEHEAYKTILRNSLKWLD